MYLIWIKFLNKNLTEMSRRMTKSTKWPVRPAKTQISLGIFPVWSESSLSAWSIGSLATHGAHSEDWSNWVDAQADLSLRRAHRSYFLLALTCCVSFLNKNLTEIRKGINPFIKVNHWLRGKRGSMLILVSLCMHVVSVCSYVLSKNKTERSVKLKQSVCFDRTLSTVCVKMLM